MCVCITESSTIQKTIEFDVYNCIRLVCHVRGHSVWTPLLEHPKLSHELSTVIFQLFTRNKEDEKKCSTDWLTRCLRWKCLANIPPHLAVSICSQLPHADYANLIKFSMTAQYYNIMMIIIINLRRCNDYNYDHI